MRSQPRLVPVALLWIMACGEPMPMPLVDAGQQDAGTRRDAGVARDAGAGGGSAGGGASGGGLPGPNVPPVVGAAIVAPMTSGFAGQLLPLSISATDANQDRLTITWTQVSPSGEQGTFFENGSANAQRWSSPETLTPTTFVLRVEVTDGRSPPETREVTVMIRPPRFTEVFANVLGVPVLQGGQCTGCHGTMGSYTVGSTANAAWSRIVNVAHNHGAGVSQRRRLLAHRPQRQGALAALPEDVGHAAGRVWGRDAAGHHRDSALAAEPDGDARHVDTAGRAERLSGTLRRE